jgi:hypothetical protein
MSALGQGVLTSRFDVIFDSAEMHLGKQDVDASRRCALVVASLGAY